MEWSFISVRIRASEHKELCLSRRLYFRSQAMQGGGKKHTILLAPRHRSPWIAQSPRLAYSFHPEMLSPHTTTKLEMLTRSSWWFGHEQCLMWVQLMRVEWMLDSVTPVVQLFLLRSVDPCQSSPVSERAWSSKPTNQIWLECKTLAWQEGTMANLTLSSTAESRSS